MPLLTAGLLLFIGIHSMAVVGLRDRAVGAFGEPLWKGLYSLVSVIGLALIVLGYAAARSQPTVLWLPPMWLRHAVLLLMVPVFPLVFAAYLPGRIQTVTKHPILVATKLWAFAHLLANGMLADLVLFGSVLGWAVAVRASLARRKPRAIPMAPAGRFNDVAAVLLGLGAYAAMLTVGHTWLIGMPLL